MTFSTPSGRDTDSKPTLPLSAAASGIVPAYSCVNAPNDVSYSTVRFCPRSRRASVEDAPPGVETLTYDDRLHEPRKVEVALEIRLDVPRVERGGHDTLIALPPCELERKHHVSLPCHVVSCHAIMACQIQSIGNEGLRTYEFTLAVECVATTFSSLR